jgi:hypothetical protein
LASKHRRRDREGLGFETEGAGVLQLLPDEAEEGREARHRQRRDRRRRGRDRHGAGEPAQDVGLPRAGAVVDDAHDQEQRRLVEGMHDEEGDRRRDRIARVGAEKERQRAERHQRRVGERLLEVGLPHAMKLAKTAVTAPKIVSVQSQTSVPPRFGCIRAIR